MGLYWHLRLRADDGLSIVPLSAGLLAMAMGELSIVDRGQIRELVVVSRDDVVDGVGAGEAAEVADAAIPCPYCPLSLWPVLGQTFPAGRTFPTVESLHQERGLQ